MLFTCMRKAACPIGGRMSLRGGAEMQGEKENMSNQTTKISLKLQIATEWR